MDKSKIPAFIKQSQDLINPSSPKSIWNKGKKKKKKTGAIANTRRKHKMLKDADDY
jgi:hypothetical protein